LRLALVDHGGLQLLFRLEFGDGGTRALHVGIRLREPCVVVPRVEADQHLIGLDALVIGDQQFGDEAVHFWRHHGYVAADVRVVRALNETQHGEPIGRSGSQHDHHHGNRKRHPADTKRPPRFALSRGRGGGRKRRGRSGHR
jgi:hypothetical protein